MGLLWWRKKTRWALAVTSPGPILPGRYVECELTATKIKPGTRIAIAWAKIQADGREDSDSSQYAGDGLPSSDSAATLRWWEQEVLSQVDFTGETMTVPLRVRLPFWSPPAMVGDTRILPALSRPSVVLSPTYGDKASFDVEALPVHHTLFAATESLGWTFRKGTLWKGTRKRPVELRLMFAQHDSFEHADVAIAHAVAVPFAIKPNTAQVAVTIYARKFPHGLFPIASVSDVLLDEDAEAWAVAIRQRLAEEIASASIPGGGVLDEHFISGVISVLLS